MLRCPPAARRYRDALLPHVVDEPLHLGIVRVRAITVREIVEKVTVHHSSVSQEERALAEERFNRGTSACIVCTSTLELGIDVGDLDRVFQAEAPATVCSFLQRMGRTGRRAGQAANTTFFCETDRRRRATGPRPGRARPSPVGPSWPRRRVLELAPAFWQETLKQEDTQERLATNVFRRVSLGEHTSEV